MKAYRKETGLTVRMTRVERAKIRRAARHLSHQRETNVSSGELLLELAMPAVDRILSDAAALAAQPQEAA